MLMLRLSRCCCCSFHNKTRTRKRSVSSSALLSITNCHYNNKLLLFSTPAVILLLLSLFLALFPTTNAMRIVVQRVKSASVTVDNQGVVSEIGPGLLALVGLHATDTATDLPAMSRKLLAAKLWENEAGKPWRQSVQQKGYDVLLVSQFTLYGRLTKKNQPDYQDSMKAIPAQALYEQFVQLVQESHTTGVVKDGIFGAMMDVALVNDGPVTIIIDSPIAQQEEEDAKTSTAVEGSEHGTASTTTSTDQ